MRTLLFTSFVLFIACGQETKPFLDEPTDTREPIAVRYVTGPELPVRERADEAAPVMITYQRGESVSVLSEKGDWVEIRVSDRSGWAKAEFVGNADAASQTSDVDMVRFARPAPSVINLTAKGEIYIEADVNTDGDVVNTKILENTTGNPALAAQNAAALKQAKFYPITKNGARMPFKYYHRVTY